MLTSLYKVSALPEKAGSFTPKYYLGPMTPRGLSGSVGVPLGRAGRVPWSLPGGARVACGVLSRALLPWLLVPAHGRACETGGRPTGSVFQSCAVSEEPSKLFLVTGVKCRGCHFLKFAPKEDRASFCFTCSWTCPQRPLPQENTVAV